MESYDSALNHKHRGPKVTSRAEYISGGRRLQENGTGQELQDCQDASIGCEDTKNGATDSYGARCVSYIGNPNWCGSAEDDDFSFVDMCCECNGNACADMFMTSSHTINKIPRTASASTCIIWIINVFSYKYPV